MEIPVSFKCSGEHLLGIFSEGSLEVGVLIVVGGPQYRVGSHRQFTLLARHLAESGIPSFRFDYRGMGDSSGNIRDFEDVNLDIKSAVDQMFLRSPGLKRVVLWGLCDAASANVFYAYTDDRVCGLVLLNPWVRTVEGEAKAFLKHYYLSRLVNKELWLKIFSGKFDFSHSMRSLFDLTRKLIRRKKSSEVESAEFAKSNQLSGTLPERMFQGLMHFDGPVLLILSGDDLTAKEFRDLVVSSSDWKSLLEKDQFMQCVVEGANHTFSTAVWRNIVETRTSNWVLELKQ